MTNSGENTERYADVGLMPPSMPMFADLSEKVAPGRVEPRARELYPEMKRRCSHFPKVRPEPMTKALTIERITNKMS